MRVTLLVLLVLLPSPGEVAELGWMKVDGNGNPTPADHQVKIGGRLAVGFCLDVCCLQDICDSVYQLSRGPSSADSIQYHTKMIPGMHCDFEEEDCQWTTVPNMEQRKVRHYFQSVLSHKLSSSLVRRDWSG